MIISMQVLMIIIYDAHSFGKLLYDSWQNVPSNYNVVYCFVLCFSELWCIMIIRMDSMDDNIGERSWYPCEHVLTFKWDDFLQVHFLWDNVYIQGLVNVQIKHHPTLGYIISSTYSRRWCPKSPKRIKKRHLPTPGTLLWLWSRI